MCVRLLVDILSRFYLCLEMHSKIVPFFYINIDNRALIKCKVKLLKEIIK